MTHITFRTAGEAVLSDEIKAYAAQKIAKIERVLGDATARFDVELSTRTNARTGSEFACEINVHHSGKFARAAASGATLHASIDECTDELRQEVEHKRGKARGMLRRGAQQLKRLFGRA